MTASSHPHPLHAPIDARLAQVAGETPEPPPWYEAWAALGPAAPEQERLAVYQAVRAAGSVPAAAGFFLVAWVLDLLADDRAEEGLRESEARLEVVRRKYGLDQDASAASDDAPSEYREAMRQAHEAWDRLYVATAEEFGEPEVARLFRTDPGRFDRLYETGRQFFHGPRGGDDEGEDWLDRLLDAVAACVEAESPMGPLGLRYREDDDFWEVWVYPTPVELVGGAHDGEVVAPGFTLDVEQLRDVFGTIRAFVWDGPGLSCPDGPHISVEGVYQGREVLLHVLAQPPEGEEPGLKVDLNRRPRPSR